MTEKLTTLADAVAHVADGQLVALAGGENSYRPLALVRELVRQGRSGLQLTGWATGLDVELLLASGAAAGASIPGAAGETVDADHAWLRFFAAERGIPFIPLDGGVEVAAQRPDVVLIHAEAVSPSGTVLSNRHREAFERDRALARSSQTVIVSAEQVVSELTVAKHRGDVLVEGADVTAALLAPFGSHPLGMTDRYPTDEEALAATRSAIAAGAEAVRSAAAEHEDHWTYLDATGIGRLIYTATDTRQETR